MACFYSSIGLNRELNDDHSQALNYYLKALDVWKNCNEIGFVLITLKHLINIAPKAGLNGSDTGNFMKLYQKLLQADDFKGVNIEQLFKDYEQRLETAKEITFNLKSFEEKLISEERSPNSHDNGEFWKQALRLRLLKSLKMAKNLISNSNTNTNPGVQIQLLSNGTDQILSTLALIQEETNPIILNKVQTMAYTKDASNSLKAAVNRIKKIILYHIYARALEKITNFSDKKAMKILKKSQITALYTKAYGEIMQGDYLIKCNNNSNGRIRKFFRLDLSGILLVATKEIFIENISKRREIDLSAVDALLYGKVTPTLIKIYNKSLENHLCFSLIYKGKTIDFYCTEDQVKSWIIALSREIKKKNPMAFCLEAGRLLWRGFRLRIIEEFKRTIEKQGGKIKIIVRESLVKAVNYFARNNKNLRLK